ncbi:MAG TPA: hypothetical protein V6D30_23495 [Leptolyngbyaceae cyanobacterium]|jgi:hypothetical protein
MKLSASTAIALALAFTAVAGQPAAVSASSVSGDSPRQDQRVTPQDHSEIAARSLACRFRIPFACF